jgi:hypothetical protein
MAKTEMAPLIGSANAIAATKKLSTACLCGMEDQNRADVYALIGVKSILLVNDSIC